MTNSRRVARRRRLQRHTYGPKMLRRDLRRIRNFECGCRKLADDSVKLAAAIDKTARAAEAMGLASHEAMVATLNHVVNAYRAVNGFPPNTIVHSFGVIHHG